MQAYRYEGYDCYLKTLSKEAFIKEMMLQKRIEFWGEGIPFYYKKRLAQGIHLSGTNCWNDVARWELDGVAPCWNLCVPITERQANPAITEQLNNPDPEEVIEPAKE